jgi:hypothetical protein
MVTDASPKILQDLLSILSFSKCARGTAFLPKIMESVIGSSAIIMEIGHSTIFFPPCPWRAQEEALPSSWNCAKEPI